MSGPAAEYEALQSGLFDAYMSGDMATLFAASCDSTQDRERLKKTGRRCFCCRPK